MASRPGSATRRSRPLSFQADTHQMVGSRCMRSQPACMSVKKSGATSRSSANAPSRAQKRKQAVGTLTRLPSRGQTLEDDDGLEVGGQLKDTSEGPSVMLCDGLVRIKARVRLGMLPERHGWGSNAPSQVSSDNEKKNKPGSWEGSPASGRVPPLPSLLPPSPSLPSPASAALPCHSLPRSRDACHFFSCPRPRS